MTKGKWRGEEEEWIDVDTLRHAQQVEILRRYGLVSHPDEIVLHPSELFDIFVEMHKKDSLNEVAMWFFLHGKMQMERFTDEGEFQSLWPAWVKATRANDEACRVLLVASLDLLPFECWFVIADCLCDKDLIGYTRWKLTRSRNVVVLK
jgi:hypothetical protein